MPALLFSVRPSPAGRTKSAAMRQGRPDGGAPVGKPPLPDETFDLLS
jgi:hypothetical protein